MTAPRRFSFSLRMVFAAVTVISLAICLLISNCNRQKAAVDAVYAAGGYVWYEFQALPNNAGFDRTQLPKPQWFWQIVDENLFFSAIDATVQGRRSTNDELRAVGRLRHIRCLQISCAPNTTDDGLRYLCDLPELRELRIYGTSITQEAARKFALDHNAVTVDWQETCPDWPTDDDGREDHE